MFIFVLLFCCISIHFPNSEIYLLGDGSRNKGLDWVLNNNGSWLVGNHLRLNVGSTKRFYNGVEVFYGISNGISWFPRFLRLGRYFNLGIGELNINILGGIYDFVRCMYRYAYIPDPSDSSQVNAKKKRRAWRRYIVACLLLNVLCGNMYIVSLRIINGFKFNFFNLANIINLICNGGLWGFDSYSDWWLHSWFEINKKFNILYGLFVPRIEIDIIPFIEFVKRQYLYACVRIRLLR